MEYLANIVSIIHVFAGIYMFVGGFFPEEYLPFYIVYMIILVGHWNFNDGHCILLSIENKLRNIPMGESGWDRSPFIKNILNKCGIDIEERQIDYSLRRITKILTVMAIFRWIIWYTVKYLN